MILESGRRDWEGCNLFMHCQGDQIQPGMLREREDWNFRMFGAVRIKSDLALVDLRL